MTLEEAIEHAKEKSLDKKCQRGCRAEHAQLANWLMELKSLRETIVLPKAKRLSWNDTHPNYDSALKSRKVGSGNFVVSFQYTDDDGVRHWKTGWYSNRSNYVDDFAENFHGNEQ